MKIAVIPAIVAKATNPGASASGPDASPPAHRIIGNAQRAIKLVPVCAPSILNPVRLVLSVLSDVILGVREEKGTLTIVKHVLCSMFAKTKKKNNEYPSKGGAQKRRIKDKAKGMFPNNR